MPAFFFRRQMPPGIAVGGFAPHFLSSFWQWRAWLFDVIYGGFLLRDGLLYGNLEQAPAYSGCRERGRYRISLKCLIIGGNVILFY